MWCDDFSAATKSKLGDMWGLPSRQIQEDVCQHLGSQTPLRNRTPTAVVCGAKPWETRSTTVPRQRGRPSTVILWGYKGLYPVAVVENASVSAVTTALGAGVVSAMASASSPTTAQMNAVANLRSVLPAAHVTTYVWSPGKGVTSVTDPAGVTTTYERDGAGRLTCVKDAAGHAVEGWTYDLLNDGGDGHLSVRHRTYRSESGTQYSEDVRWWNTLGLVEEDVSIGASGQMGVSGINDDLVTAYEGDWMLHDDVKAWLPYPVSGTGGFLVECELE